MAFAPDGRLFYGERIEGNIRIIDTNDQLLTQPFLTLDVPHDGNGNLVRHRSAGIRGFAFDPDYDTNGFFYVFYMKQFAGGVRHNRVSRFQADPANANVALAGSETVLLEIPFNNGGLGDSGLGSSGSHNGGAVTFGGDGKLYFTTGDGWNASAGYGAGDTVQSLSTFTGKAFRLNKDGTIPTDNPFYNQATGDYRAIYALGLRNPYAATTNPQTGEVFIFDVGTVWGGDKDYVFRLGAGDNYKHDGDGGIGTIEAPWLETGSAIISGGAWYFSDQFPAEYVGNLFVTGWSGDDVRIIESDTDPTVTVFASDEVVNSGPLYIQVGPDGSLYYLKSTYETANGEIYKISYTGSNTVSTPVVSPLGGAFIQSVDISVTAFTTGASFYYTTDGSDPTESSTLYTAPISITNSLTLKVRGFKAGLNPSAIVTASYTIDPGTAPFITTMAQANALKDALYQYDVDASGVPNPTFILDQFPAGMTIDSTTGIISWTPITAGDFDVTVRASNGIGSDDTESFTLTVIDLKLAETPLNLVNGLHYSYYEGDFDVVPDYRVLRAIKAGHSATLDLSTRVQDDQFMYRFYGYIEVPVDGNYTFYLSSDDGSLLFIGDTLVVDNDAVHTEQEASGIIGLQAGKHRISVEYFDNAGPDSLSLSYAGPGITKITVPMNSFFRHQTPYGLDTRPSSPAYLNFPTVENSPIPQTLSLTGAFDDLSTLTPTPGVIPYGVNSPLWSDGAEKLRYISLPTGSHIDFAATGPWSFPAGTVFIKHFEIGNEKKRLETRFFIVKDDLTVYGITYKWRSDQSDADLVSANGFTEEILFDGGKLQTWYYPSRQDCFECHNASTNYVLGVRTGQQNGDLAYPSSAISDNQLRTWNHLGLFSETLDETTIATHEAWSSVTDESEPLEHRAKSYMAANCAFCHNSANPMEGAHYDARFETALADMALIGVDPENDLGINGAKIVKSQNPHLSTLYQRINTNDDAIQMPPLARNIIDESARDAVLKWIISLDSSMSADVLDYVSRWKFDGNLVDETTAATAVWRNGGSGNYASAQLDQGIVFNGVDDAIDLGGYDLSGDSMAITFWCYIDDFGVTDARFISKADDSTETAHYWMVSTLNSTKLRFRLKTDGITSTLSSSSGTLTAGVWTHVAAVYDGAFMRLYKDGVELAQLAKTGSIDQNAAIPVSIGNQPASATDGIRSFDGTIDDLRIYNRALTAAEVEIIRTTGSILNQSPTASITAPANSGPVVQPTNVTFTGSATDPEDGDVTDTAQWISNRDGLIGTGASFSTTLLSPGDHLILMTVTDSDNASKSELIAFNVLSVFENWIQGYSLSGDDALPFANPDSGISSNLLEFFLGGNPTVNDDHTLQPMSVFSPATSDTIGLQFRKVASGLTHRLMFSTDLESWTNASLEPTYVEAFIGSDTDGADLYEASFKKEGREQIFLRLEVEE